MRGVIDLRLVPAALAVWAVTLLGVRAGWVPAAILAGLSVTTSVVTASRYRPRSWKPGSRVPGVLAVLIMAGVAAAGVGARSYQVEHHPLRQAADGGERATVRMALTTTPKPLHGASYGARKAEDSAIVRAQLRTADVSGHRFRAGGEVLALVQTQQWRGLVPGQEITARGKLVPPRAGDLTVAVLQVHRPPSQVGRAPPWQRVAEDLRDGLRRSSSEVLGPAAASLLPGLVVGDTGGLPPEVVEEFRTSGLTHLTAVSGSNLAIVCGAVLLLLRLVGAGPVLASSAAGLALVGFVVLAGPEPSVLRAAVMGAVTLLALLLGRDRSALPALAVSVIGLLLLSPELATAAGFALSVAATAGLVLLAPAWSQFLRDNGVPAGFAEAVAVATAAHVVTAPLIAAISGEVSTVGILANTLAEPVVAPATVLGVLATVVAPLSSWAAQALVWLAGPELEWVLAVAHHAAAVPGAEFGWPSGAVGGVLLAALVAGLLITLRSRRFRWALAAVVLLAGLVLVPVQVLGPRWPVDGWSAITCDVGQGDGLVLATGTPGEAVVVDTGPDPTLMADCLRRLGIRRVPLVVLTHLHADHVGGLSSVLADRAVGAVAVGGPPEPAWAAADVARESAQRGVPRMRLSTGQHARWPALALDVLGPTGSLATTTSSEDANDASTVLMATTPAGRILLTGDIALPGQSRLLASGADLRADVLKVPHHGSRYTTPRFLAAVRPRLALISVGEGNSYGHPSPLVLGALARDGVKILRTDEQGDVAVFGDARELRSASRGDPVRADDP